ERGFVVGIAGRGLPEVTRIDAADLLQGAATKLSVLEDQRAAALGAPRADHVARTARREARSDREDERLRRAHRFAGAVGRAGAWGREADVVGVGALEGRGAGGAGRARAPGALALVGVPRAGRRHRPLRLCAHRDVRRPPIAGHAVRDTAVHTTPPP